MAKRRLLAVVCTLSLVLAVISFGHGLSSYLYEQADSHYKRYQLGDRADMLRANQAALISVNQSLRLNPHNAPALDLKGLLLYRQWWLQPTQAKQQSLLRDALLFYEKSLQYRQHWPYTYFSMARVHAESDKLAPSFYHYFDLAYRYGRYETGVGSSLMYLGADNWRRLEFSYQIKVMELARLTLEKKSTKPKSMGLALKSRKILDEICWRLVDTKRKKQMCSV